jgi:hypothetical protein
MWIQFFLENAHFALNIFAALVMFAVAWLYFDAFLVRKATKEGLRTLGFIILSISFIIHASDIESSLLTSALIPPAIQALLFFGFHISGYILIIISLILDPIQPKPQYAPENAVARPNTPNPTVQAGIALPAMLGSVLSPIAVFAIAGLYLYRATIGLERHLYKVSFAFILIAVGELIGLRSLLVNSPNVDIYNMVMPFGFLWCAEHVFLLGGLLLLAYWVFGYLLKRFETQLFMIFVSSILVIFLLTTVSFTGLLVNNLMNENLRQLTTDAQVLALSIDSKKAESLSDAQLLAQDPRILEAITKNDRRKVAEIASTYLLNKKQSTIIVTNKSGIVLANGEDIERYGDSLSGDELVKRAIAGEESTAITTVEGILSPSVAVRASTPIKNGTEIIGSVISGNVIDSAVLDGIKKATGLDASLYGDNKLSATTLVTSDGVTRPVGIREENSVVKTTVLTNAKPFTGSVNLLNRPYFASYLPLTDAHNSPVGMIMVGRPQLTILQTASRSIELTFLLTTLLILLTPIPAYAIARYIAKQVH